MNNKEHWDAVWREDKYSDVVRIEVIDRNGRSYITYNVKDLQLSLQDKGCTLKIFIDNSEGEDVYSNFKEALANVI